MIARVVIAGASSSSGKTTVTSGLIGALRARGHVVQPFKVGPDFIDPSYHALASGRPGRNLDVFLCGPELVAPLVRHGAGGAEVAVIEGMMGLFDGASSSAELASTAHVAKLLAAPVVLVVDGSAMARSVAALVHGFRTFDAQLNLAGVIFNRVGSEAHARLLREAVQTMPGPPLRVLGALRLDPRLRTPERHLGLVPAGERLAQAREALAELADAAADQLDLDGFLDVARRAPADAGPTWSPAAAVTARTPARIAIARGPAFSFHYEENLELMAAAGAELAPFDPTADLALPAGSDGLILAGGFPESFAPELAANAPLRAAIARFAAAGHPVLAECGGLLYLGERLGEHPMCGVLPIHGRMTDQLTLGYREATAVSSTPWLVAGARVRGHEFHYSHADTGDRAGLLRAWRLSAPGSERADGFVSGAVQAGYLHVHWAAYPELAQAFVASAAGTRRTAGHGDLLD